MISGFIVYEKGNTFTQKKLERVERSRFLFYNGRIMSRLPGENPADSLRFYKNRII